MRCAPPSRCDDEARSSSGQYGQCSGLFSLSGGRGINFNRVTDARLAVDRADAVRAGVAAADDDDALALDVDRVGRTARHLLVLRNQELSAAYTPLRSRPWIGRSRGTSEPAARITASKSALDLFGGDEVARIAGDAGRQRLAAIITPV